MKAVVIHGGAGPVDETNKDERENLQQKLLSLQTIVEKSWNMLQSNASALDVVQQAVVMLENNPAFNAGVGAAIGNEGQIELDASIMDGTTGDFGAVTGIRVMKNPILVACTVLSMETNLIHGVGANRLARRVAKELGITLGSDKDLSTPFKLKQWREWKKGGGRMKLAEGGTVGVVAFDGVNIAAGTSTGGMTGKPLGRVGDSALPGGGTFANQIGGASATGAGEKIMMQASTRQAIYLLEQGLSPQRAAARVTRELQSNYNGRGGIILLNNKGEIGIATNTSHMPNAMMSSQMKTPLVNKK